MNNPSGSKHCLDLIVNSRLEENKIDNYWDFSTNEKQENQVVASSRLADAHFDMQQKAAEGLS